MPWLSLTVRIEGASAEAFSDALLEAGAESVSIEQPGHATPTVSALLPADADASSIVSTAASLCGLQPLPAFELARLEDEDWVLRTQAQFSPVAIGARLWIGPSWHQPPEHFAAVVRLDPGLAFGTGSHATTKLVLAYIEKHLKDGERVLDYGCGSGILAIAAAKLGAGHVDAVDLDEQAVEVTRRNAAANGVAVNACPPEALAPARYDLVVSNILAQPLVMLAPLLAARTAERGGIALSGILESQAEGVVRAYTNWFDIEVVAREEQWALLAGRRR